MKTIEELNEKLAPPEGFRHLLPGEGERIMVVFLCEQIDALKAEIQDLRSELGAHLRGDQ